MMKNPKKTRLIYLLGIIVVAIIFMIPTWLNGISDGMDLDQHFQFASSVERSIRTGDLFPHWAGQENHGYGGVGLRFYPTLAYYVLASAKILTNDWYLASCLAFLFWSILSGFGIYFWAREWFTERASFMAAALYIFAPYHALQLYSAFFYAEFSASAILPFCFLFVTRVCRRGKLVDIIGFSISYAVLIFTHIPLAVIGSLAIGVYALTQIDFKSFLSQSGKLLLGLVLGLSASCFQWIRVVTEIQWLAHAANHYSQDGMYNYRQNFLLSFPYLAGIDADNRNLWFADLCLLVTLVFTIPLAIIFFKKAESALKRQIWGVLILAIFAIFMASILSRPIWDNFAFMQKVQFPWRWFSVISMSLVILSAAGFEFYLAFARDKKLRPVFLIITGCLMIGFAFTHAQVIRQAVFLPWEQFAVRSEKFATKSNCECWLPIWAKPEAQNIQEKVIAQDRNVTIESWKDREINLKVEGGKEVKARLALYYYPHWSATINNQPVELNIAEDGAVLIPIPSEKSDVTLRFEEPFIIKFAAYFTLSIWLIFILIGLSSIKITSRQLKTY